MKRLSIAGFGIISLIAISRAADTVECTVASIERYLDQTICGSQYADTMILINFKTNTNTLLWGWMGANKASANQVLAMAMSSQATGMKLWVELDAADPRSCAGAGRIKRVQLASN